MTTAVRSARIAEESPRLKSRIAGFLWLSVIATGLIGFIAGSTVIVRGDAVATATNLVAHESLYRLGFVCELISALCYVGVTVLLHYVLKPVSATLSLLAAFFGLGGVAIGGAAFLSRLAPLVLLQGDQASSAFTASQLQAMALMSLKLYVLGFNISMVFFGIQCFLIGCLILRSAFLPKILGFLLAIGGSSYIISSLANFLSPSFGAMLAPFILPAAIVGEGSLTLWLLLKGVHVQRWHEQASAVVSSQ